ncbi:hypothetical protein L1887_44000 [Cichorium endivia]|nr:hypothetical protein L1887_44000 [Cichorium endivia]
MSSSPLSFLMSFFSSVEMPSQKWALRASMEARLMCETITSFSLKVSAEHLGGLVHGMFDLDRHTTADVSLEHHVALLVVDLERRHLAQMHHRLLARGRVRLDDTQWRSDAQRAVNNVAPKNDGITLGKARDGLETTRPHGGSGRLLLLALHHLVVVLGKGILEVVDDLGGEDLDSELLGKLLGFLVDGHIECKDDSKLLGLFKHGRASHHVLLEHGPDVDAVDGNLADAQELEQRLKRSERRRLHADTATGRVDGVHERAEIAHHLVLEVLLVVIGADDEQARARRSPFRDPELRS